MNMENQGIKKNGLPWLASPWSSSTPSPNSSPSASPKFVSNVAKINKTNNQYKVQEPNL
jgi:hypothetical protein